MAYGPVTAVVICLITSHRILAITMSSRNEVEEMSAGRISVSCNQLSPNSTIYWIISPVHGQVKKVGMCEMATCTSAYRPSVYPERLNPSSSSLFFLNVTREWAGTVVCTERLANGTEQSVNSTLDVYYNSGVNYSSFVINREDWSLTFIFNVTKVFSALGNYGTELHCPYMTSKTNVSLVSYNESSLTYNVGYFLLTLLRRYTYSGNVFYRCAPYIIVYPGAKHFALPRRSFTDLSTPKVGCNQSYIPEEGPVSCSCSSTLLGHPDARLRWMLREKVVASGDYGVGWLPLPPEIVNRSHNGTYLVCEVEWLYNRRYQHKILVAYGPDDITIRAYRVLSLKDTSNETLLAAYPVISDHVVYLPPDNTSEVTLICEVRNVQPLMSEMVTWSGMCDGQQGFTCKLTFKGRKDDGKEVTCTVTNDANNNHTANTSIILNASEGPNNVSIQYHTISTPGKCQVILICKAPGVKPSTRDMFEWGGICEDQQGSRCVITVGKEEDDGKEVTCTVTNHVNHGRTASTSVTLTLSGCEDKDDLMGKGVGIGIGVTLTLVLVVGVVAVVIWRRRRFKRDLIYDKPNQEQRLSHTYELTRAAREPHYQESQEQIAIAPSPPCEVYENITTAKPVKAKQQRQT